MECAVLELGFDQAVRTTSLSCSLFLHSTVLRGTLILSDALSLSPPLYMRVYSKSDSLINNLKFNFMLEK